MLILAIVPLLPINNIVSATQIFIRSSQDRSLDETICPRVEPRWNLVIAL